MQAPADGIARTLLRLHADRGVAIQVHVPPQHWMRGQREDLDEILGNLLDNACTWARSRVIVTSAAADGALVIDVDDDGPGLPPAMWEAVLQRRVRADEAAPGPGFGLAIVRDLAELYGGSIALGRAPAGGCVRGFSCPPDDARREAARPPGMHRRRTALVKRARRRAGSRSRAS